MNCAWCELDDNEPSRKAIAIYKGDSLCETHLHQKREEVKREWRQYLVKKRRSNQAPW